MNNFSNFVFISYSFKTILWIPAFAGMTLLVENAFFHEVALGPTEPVLVKESFEGYTEKKVEE